MQDLNIPGVYALKFSQDDIYIGSTLNIAKRLKEHRRGQSWSKRLHTAREKHGTLELHIIADLSDRKNLTRGDLEQLEYEWIRLLAPNLNLEWSPTNINQLTKKAGVKYHIVYKRIRYGWPLDEALSKPPKVQKQPKLYEIDGVNATLYAHCKRLKIVSVQVANHRVKKLCWPADRAVKTPPKP
jgi:predicted GIY-YIG superfamily endonuclease